MNRPMKKPKGKQRVSTLVLAVLLAAIIGGGCPAAASPPSPEGSITIHKFRVDSYDNLKEGTGSQSDSANIPADAEKLAGIYFRLEKLRAEQGETPGPDSPRDSAFEAIEKATDTNGELVFPRLAEGLYLVTELLPECCIAQSEKFLIQIPMEDNYDVHVYPKNMGKDEIIAKQLDAERLVYGLGEEIPWAIAFPLGHGIQKDLHLFDQMDARLDYVAGSASLAFLDTDEQPVKEASFIHNIDYTESYDAGRHTVTWAFTDAAVKKLTDHHVIFISVKLLTSVNNSALGTSANAVWNNAGIKFTNTAGDPCERQVFDPGKGTEGVNVPKAWLGSVTIVKLSAGAGREKLPGAVFKAAADEASAKAGNYLQRDGKDIEVTTDAQGKAVIDVLGAGDFWLVETRAPAGYELLKAPIKAVIENNPEKRLASMEIINQPQGGQGKPGEGGRPGPITGDDIKIIGYALLATGALAGLIWLFWPRRKKQAAGIKP
ncbi:MAG: SpaH/EbpB family LPXTG-anchored major pilin [Oscillospiraceae bacterium]|nr:SpaH/EbpB family LPXTG-anchored major pilin [Oscillospiraceae bacterium]